jgi:uncharacterized membrane protein YqgA involved in biofilm formation
MFLKTQNPIIVLVSILTGGVIGEILRIETRLESLGIFLENKFSKENNLTLNNINHKPSDQKNISTRTNFIHGFLTSSLVFCIGPMAILGSIQDGLTGDYSLLAIKSILDGFASVAFAASLGFGVIFSALIVLIFQGGISLFAGVLRSIVTTASMDELTAVGGVILIGLAISSLLEIKKIRVGNFLPALIIAPVISLLLAALGLN